MSTVDTTELRRLLAAASDAPWRRCQANDRKCICGLVWSLPEDATVSAFVGDESQNATDRDHHNADLIVALRNHAAALLDAFDERERLRGASGCCVECERLTRAAEFNRNELTRRTERAEQAERERDEMRAKLGALVEACDRFMRAPMALEASAVMAMRTALRAAKEPKP